MKVRLVATTVPRLRVETPDLSAEGLIAYCARVSSPNQDNPKYAGLLRYCIDHKHWSIFEQADMTLEIETSRAIASQLLRHKSFVFQQHSLRYSEATEFEVYDARRQDDKNRQNSIDDMSYEDKKWFIDAQDITNRGAVALYNGALARGIAKEQARFLLPLSTRTRLYMKGSVRSWIHYIEVRADVSTQKEHRDIALDAKRIFTEEFPKIAEALKWG